MREVKRKEPIVASLYQYKVERGRKKNMNLKKQKIYSTSDQPKPSIAFKVEKKDLIIYPVTAYFEHKALLDYRRANVAFTRARCKLIILSSLRSIIQTAWLKYLKRKAHQIEINDDALRPELDIVKSIHNSICRL